MSLPIKPTDYVFNCSRCHKDFISDTDKVQMMTAYKKDFGKQYPGRVQRVCQECYDKVMKHHRAVIDKMQTIEEKKE